ncbi:MAG: transcriptional regulator [Desulfobacterales bacterium SG8_35]|jgi:sugar fermentation stimulation protein A|nr:MAG: transcriptional regulator [Desulfobacterales bacterium SG8_35]
MRFEQRLQSGILIRRYKRFLADIELADGSLLTVHCPNSGSMMGCSKPGSPVLFSRSDNPGRKYPHTLEMIQAGDTLVGVNTSLTNKLVRESLENGVVTDFGRLESIMQEVKTSDNTRLDFLLQQDGQSIFMEVKNCSLAENRVAMFPDAVTVRGTKHLHELAALKNQGHGGAVFFCVQRGDADWFMPASHIDPVYAGTLAQVAEAGVLVIAYQAKISPEEIKITRRLPVKLQ